MLEILTYSFIQRALIAGLVSGFVLSFLGIFVNLRRMSFFSDGLAHATLAGIAIGIISGVNPLWLALLVSVLFASGIYLLEQKTTVSSDALIGIFFTASMALGVILLSFKKGYQPELISFLFGNILSVGSLDLALMIVLGIIISLFLTVFYRKLALLILDREEAWLLGINTGALDFTFYILLALAVVLGVKILGIILVSALLIIPSATAKLISRSLKNLLKVSIFVGELVIILGFFVSYYFNLPSGATIILIGALLFFIIVAFSGLKKFIK